MRVLDPGHRYELARLDGEGVEILQFVKRIGQRYPGNVGVPTPGTTSQEVLRALLDRARYVNRQIPCVETEAAIGLLQTAITLFEIRAKRVKGKHLNAETLHEVECGEICPVCSHVFCREDHR